MTSFITQSDLANYGPDLVDFSQRAAAQVLAPQLQQIHQDNAELLGVVRAAAGGAESGGERAQDHHVGDQVNDKPRQQAERRQADHRHALQDRQSTENIQTAAAQPQLTSAL